MKLFSHQINCRYLLQIPGICEMCSFSHQGVYVSVPLPLYAQVSAHMQSFTYAHIWYNLDRSGQFSSGTCRDTISVPISTHSRCAVAVPPTVPVSLCSYQLERTWVSPEKPLGDFGPITLCLWPEAVSIYERDETSCTWLLKIEWGCY